MLPLQVTILLPPLPHWILCYFPRKIRKPRQKLNPMSVTMPPKLNTTSWVTSVLGMKRATKLRRKSKSLWALLLISATKLVLVVCSIPLRTMLSLLWISCWVLGCACKFPQFQHSRRLSLQYMSETLQWNSLFFFVNVSFFEQESTCNVDLICSLSTLQTSRQYPLQGRPRSGAI